MIEFIRELVRMKIFILFKMRLSLKKIEYKNIHIWTDICVKKERGHINVVVYGSLVLLFHTLESIIKYYKCDQYAATKVE